MVQREIFVLNPATLRLKMGIKYLEQITIFYNSRRSSAPTLHRPMVFDIHTKNQPWIIFTLPQISHAPRRSSIKIHEFHNDLSISVSAARKTNIEILPQFLDLDIPGPFRVLLVPTIDNSIYLDSRYKNNLEESSTRFSPMYYQPSTLLIQKTNILLIRNIH